MRPSDSAEDRDPEPLAVIACGAIAREIRAVITANGLRHVSLHCLPAILHNTPQKIVPAVQTAITAARRRGCTRIFIAYADCGTGGGLDALCRREGVTRIPGPHCYAFYRGNHAFAKEAETHLTTFWLTDFLARQFDAFVARPFKLDRHPELVAMLFGHYERVVYLAQTDDAALDQQGREIAARLGLAYERRLVGYGDLAPVLVDAAFADPEREDSRV